MKKKVLICTALFIAFAYGLLVGYKKIFPFRQLWSIKSSFNGIAWDKQGNKFERKYFEHISIKSSLDEKIQNAYIYKSKNKNRPLIISLHTWSNTYKQYDPLATFAEENDINYIHPDFRGANWTPDACCSEKAISDIDDSIQYMIDNVQINQDNINVVGSSGGGYAALCAYFKTKFKIKQFLSWVPITELQDWYIESKVRGNSFADDIYKCTNSSQNVLNFEEVKKRSPMYFDLNSNTFPSSILNIYAGIHDGFRGGVPITHSINMYNEILKKDNANRELMVQKEDIKYMLANKSSVSLNYGEIEGRKIFYHRKYKKISLTIFDGSHEKLVEHIKKKILE